MERSEEGLRKALARIRELKKEFWSDVKVLGTNEELNQALERAGRVADFFELGELMCIDALVRRESCGGHFRVESQTQTVRRCAMTMNSHTCRPGNLPATTIGRFCTKSRWSMSTSS
jgi:succinate dehydrogenase / fumarate reductase flavoprotein subunit